MGIYPRYNLWLPSQQRWPLQCKCLQWAKVCVCVCECQYWKIKEICVCASLRVLSVCVCVCVCGCHAYLMGSFVVEPVLVLSEWILSQQPPLTFSKSDYKSNKTCMQKNTHTGRGSSEGLLVLKHTYGQTGCMCDGPSLEDSGGGCS